MLTALAALLVAPMPGAPHVAGAVSGSLMLALLCMFASGNQRKWGGVAGIVATALLLTAAAGAAFQVGAASGALPAGPPPEPGWLLWIGVGVSAGLGALVMVFVQKARAARAEAGAGPPPADAALTPADRVIRIVLLAAGVAGGAVTLALIAGPFLSGVPQAFARPVPSPEALAGAVGFTLLVFYAAFDLRSRLMLVAPIIAAALLAALASLPAALWSSASGAAQLWGLELSAGAWRWVAVAAPAALASVLWPLKLASFRVRLRPAFLSTAEYRTLAALADVLMPKAADQVRGRDIANNVDGYLSRMQARRRWVHRAALLSLHLHPLLHRRAPLSALDEEGRLDHLKTHFVRDVRLRLIPEWWRRMVQAMIRVAQQLTYIGYYNDPRTFEQVGYVPFSQRPRYRQLERQGRIPAPAPHPLAVHRPADVDRPEDEADVCIVGSGAAGAILAYRLAERGLDVVVLERGRYVEPREFTEDEVDMIGKLYADGLFQQTEDFRFTVLQGSCVGGSTVVNNAVCFRPPDRVLDRWNTEFGAGLDRAELDASLDTVEDFLSIHPQREGAPENPNLRLNPSGENFLEGVRRTDHLAGELETDVVSANIQDCLGCGYCNIGCAFKSKLSMLDTVLPWAQRDFPGRVRIYAEAPARKILWQQRNGGRRATAVQAALSDKRTLTVRARRIVVAAGTVASSYLLMRSGIGRGLPVGRHVSFNMGAPITAEFPDELDAFDGLQISHYGLPRTERGWVLETWWNPPASQAVNMPGWFEDHYRNMLRYRRLMGVGVLVGTERNARIVRALTGGPGVEYVPTPGDLRKLADGLVQLGGILFAAGATRVMINGWDYYEFRGPNSLAEIFTIVQDPTNVALGTGHPQGGNALSTDPARGVVGPDFRVHGFENLHVCDASVFPSSLTVNPQETVMALAQYAAPRIAER